MTEELANCMVATNNFDTLQGVICNGTAVNTGRLSGVIMRLELFLERPFQWIVCLLHLKVFIFCHLFDAIDRKTRAPATFSSEIRKKIQKNVHQLQPITFQSIPVDTPQISQKIVTTFATSDT